MVRLTPGVSLVNTEQSSDIYIEIIPYKPSPYHWLGRTFLLVKFLLAPLGDDVEYLEGCVADSTDPGQTGQQSEGPPGAHSAHQKSSEQAAGTLPNTEEE